MTCHQECCLGCPSLAPRPFGSTAWALGSQRPNRLLRLCGGSIGSATATPEWVGYLRPTRPTHLAGSGTYPGPTTTFSACGITAKTAGSSPMTSPSTVNSRLPGLDPDFLRAGKDDPCFVQVVRSSKNRGGELEHLLHPDVFYDHEVKEPVLGVGPRRREPTATGVAAVADRQVDRAKFALRTVQR